jgi:1-phosphofructokinase
MVADPDTTRLAVFAPSTQLSVTIETAAGVDELHVHPAGQGFWVARMLGVLGERPVLCTPVGGETGTALRALLGDLSTDGLIECPTPNGSYVHDRRSGERVEIALLRPAPLDRHVVDDLVSITLATGMGTPVAVVCGSNLDMNVDVAVFERVCRDLRASGAAVVADLSGDELRSALEGGVDLLKISAEELIDGGWSTAENEREVLGGVERLRRAGAVDVVVSRAEDGALAVIGDRCYRVTPPEMSVVEARGAGDSMTAALAVGLLRGSSDIELLQLGAAAAALNVTRHGLASGHPDAIERLGALIDVARVDIAAGSGRGG